MKRVSIVLVLLALLAVPALGVSAQEPVQCASDYTVEAGDWLSTIAERLLGDVQAYPAIVEATNAQTDTAYATIDDPDLIYPGWVLCIPGEGDGSMPDESESATSETATLTGTVTYRQRSALPDTAIVDVQLADISLADAPATVISEQSIQTEGRQVPIPFELTYDPTQIDERFTYAVRATITDGAGTTLFRTTQVYPVLTRDAPTSDVEIVVEPAEPAASTGSMVGIYKQFLPAADTPGIDATLYINQDNSVRHVFDYQNGEAPLVEIGTWEIDGASGDVVVTLTGRPDQEYEKPQTLRLTPDAGTLVPAQAPAAPWTSFGKLATNPDAIPYDPEPARQAFAAGEYAGIYKAMLPSADCCGRDITVYLNTDNSARVQTDFLNGEAPIVQEGSWEATDGGVTIVLGDVGEMALTAVDGVLVTGEESSMPSLQLYQFRGLAGFSIGILQEETEGQ